MMRTTWMARSVSGITAAFLISGCGGGGDGGSPTVTPPPATTNPPATLQLSNTTLAASANTSQSAPAAEFSVRVVTSAPAGTQFYLKGKFTEHGIASITSLDTVGDLTITFQSPASLGAGTYQDTVTIEACYDSACSQEVSDSPQTMSVTYSVTDGAATLATLSPATAQAGVAFTLTIDGSDFVATSVVMLNGNVAVPTTFVSATQLTASISTSAIAQPGSYNISVMPSATSDLVSNSLTLSVYADPSITGLAPGAVAAGYPGFTLSVTGTNFPIGAVVLFGGTALPTSWVTATQLTATITAAQVVNAGTIPVTVAISSAPGAPVSAPVSFSVQPLPALTPNSVDPSIVTAGGPGFVLTVLGQGFAPQAVIQWNGTTLQTTYVSELQLQAQVPASYIASTGTAAITVQNSTAAGGTSTPLTLKIAAAAPDAVSMQITPDHAGAITFKSLSFPIAGKWSMDVGGRPSYAIIADGKVVVSVNGSNGQELIALDQATGATIWGPVDIAGDSIAYDGGKVFVLGRAESGPAPLQSYDIESGTLDWSVAVGADVSQGLTASNGLLYMLDSNGTLFGLSEGAGSIAWSAPNLAGILGTPAATSTGVYASYPCFTYGFEPLTGAQIFSTNTACAGAGSGTTVVANGLVYAGVGTGGGAVVDASSGAVVGSFTSTGPPAFNATTGYFLQSGTLNALSSTNAVLWSFTGDGALTTSPIVVNQAVIIGSSTGNVYALNAATGQQLWTINAGGTLLPTNDNDGLAAGDGLLIVPAGNQVVAYTLSTNP